MTRSRLRDGRPWRGQLQEQHRLRNENRPLTAARSSESRLNSQINKFVYLLVMPVTPFEIMASKIWIMALVVVVACAISLVKGQLCAHRGIGGVIPGWRGHQSIRYDVFRDIPRRPGRLSMRTARKISNLRLVGQTQE